MGKLESMEKQNRDATPQPKQEAADLASALVPQTVESEVPETEEPEMGGVQETDEEEQREREEDTKNGPRKEGVSDEIVKEEAFPMQEIESLCMRCGENGITRLLMTRIPHFREIILMAFECPHCNEKNNEVQFAGQLQLQGCIYTLKVPTGDMKVLSRQVVKSESATIKVPELDFEVPPEAQRGTLSTIEGVLLRAAEELGLLQDERKKVDPQQAEALDNFLEKLKSYAAGEKSFTFIITDPAGNSFIENPSAPLPDPLLSIRFFDRSPEEQAALGFLVDANTLEQKDGRSSHEDKIIKERQTYTPAGTTKMPHGAVGAELAHRAIAQGSSADVVAALFKYSAPEEVMTFPSTCGACGARCETRMYATNIPYFKEVIVMASTCDMCGYRSSELKAGGSIPAKGKRISVKVLNRNDLSRDVIKSDTASVIIPELDLELASGTLGGLVTTIEGLLNQINENASLCAESLLEMQMIPFLSNVVDICQVGRFLGLFLCLHDIRLCLR